MKSYRTSIFVISLLGSLTTASGSEMLEEIDVRGERNVGDDRGEEIAPFVRDVSESLNNIPGVSTQAAGGISSLPVIHGLADDRINIEIDGAQITASCPNHMNPALSYVEPESISEIHVYPGITPVSAGGDSLGGSIIVKTNKLRFSEADGVSQALRLKTFYRSNNENTGASARYSLATRDNFAEYQGIDEKANNYRTSEGKRVKATLFNRNSQSLTLGRKIDRGQFSLRYQHTIIPYEGFANQWMDMTDNTSNHLLGNFKKAFGRLSVEASASHQHTNHMMDILRSERDGMMPMYTRSDEDGVDLKFSYESSERHVLGFGGEYNRYRIDDWWPGLAGVTQVMGPGEFQSINNGKRDRFGFFIEADSEWSSVLSTNIGFRTDIVSMKTGRVHGYNETDNLPVDAESFNSGSREKTDRNYDFTMISKAKLSPEFDIELTGGRKSRSPNLYERFAWAGSVTDPTIPMNMSSMSASMDMLMINWFGDGNGYVGDVNLKPEVAHKLSASFVAHDELQKKWEIRLTPYYTDIEGFIDADLIGRSMGPSFLRFANHDAVIFGADFSATARMQDTTLKAGAGYTRGYRKDGRTDLYHLMPINGNLTLSHNISHWTGEITGRFVGPKKQVNSLRNEPTTPGYALIDVGSAYRFSQKVRLQIGVRNIADHKYALPLGGVDIVNNPMGTRKPLMAMGRSYDLALTIDL